MVEITKKKSQKKKKKSESEIIFKYILYTIPLIIISAIVFTAIEGAFPRMNSFFHFIFIGIVGMIIYIVYWKIGLEKQRKLS